MSKETDKTKIETDELKEVEFYSNQVQAFFTTALEKDKSILTLSSGAIGLLITFGSNFNITNITEKLLYIFSLISFLICIIILILIFGKNKDYIIADIKEKKELVNKHEQTLKYLDNSAMFLFLLGVILATILSISLIIKPKIKENLMNRDDIIEKTVKEIEKRIQNGENIQVSIESFSGMINLKIDSKNSNDTNTTDNKSDSNKSEKKN